VAGEGRSSSRETLHLFDWRRRVTDLYAEIRAADDPRSAWDRWRAVRDELLTAHPQSPIPAARRRSFAGPEYFDYDPGFRFVADVGEAEPEHFDVQGSAGESFGFTRFGTARFDPEGEALSLGLYWMDGYAGGLFLSFRDATSGKSTYGAGRYLFDTVKGADLGRDGAGLILDFNFSYNPSCAYDPSWACPLAPPDNRLPVAIPAGEKAPPKPG
jgi:uncharacterized protein (DUF1684 family)